MTTCGAPQPETRAGYDWHRCHGEAACGGCRKANNEYQAPYQAAVRASRAGHRVYVIRFPGLRLCYVGSTIQSVGPRLLTHKAVPTTLGRLLKAGHEHEIDVFDHDSGYEMLETELRLGMEVPPEERLHQQLSCPRHPRVEAMIGEETPAQ